MPTVIFYAVQSVCGTVIFSALIVSAPPFRQSRVVVRARRLTRTYCITPHARLNLLGTRGEVLRLFADRTGPTSRSGCSRAVPILRRRCCYAPTSSPAIVFACSASVHVAFAHRRYLGLIVLRK